MKTKISHLIVGIFVGLIISIFIFIVSIQSFMFSEVKSAYSFEETFEIINKEALKDGWKNPHTYDLQETLQKNGFAIDKTTTISFCKPNHAINILNHSNHRNISSIMPCRVAIYENDGEVFVSTLNSSLFSKLMNRDIKRYMSQASEEMDNIIQKIKSE
jgi:uncharacterized protein (DUF302 family)